MLTAAGVVKASPLILALKLQRGYWHVLSEDSPQTHTEEIIKRPTVAEESWAP